MNDDLWFIRWECHRWFDNLWHTHSQREKLYIELANELGIEKDKCHFSSMSKEQLELALKTIKKWWFEKYDH